MAPRVAERRPVNEETDRRSVRTGRQAAVIPERQKASHRSSEWSTSALRSRHRVLESGRLRLIVLAPSHAGGCGEPGAIGNHRRPRHANGHSSHPEDDEVGSPIKVRSW